MRGQKATNAVHLKLTTKIVSAYASSNAIPVRELSNLIGNVHKTLLALAKIEIETPLHTPAAPIKGSVQRDYIVCLEDGRKFKSLKRHLAAYHALSPDEYRKKWGLAWDYPMTAPAYSTTRSALAKDFGLGRRPKVKPQQADSNR